MSIVKKKLFAIQRYILKHLFICFHTSVYSNNTFLQVWENSWSRSFSQWRIIFIKEIMWIPMPLISGVSLIDPVFFLWSAMYVKYKTIFSYSRAQKTDQIISHKYIMFYVIWHIYSWYEKCFFHYTKNLK